MVSPRRDNFLNGYHFYARAFDVLVPGHKVRFFNLHLHSIQLSNDDKQFYVDLTKLKTKDKPSEAKQASKTIFAKLTNAFRQHAQEAALLRQVINQSDANVIVCGDFNDVPMSYAYRKIMGNDMTDAWVKCGFGPQPLITTTGFSSRLTMCCIVATWRLWRCIATKRGRATTIHSSPPSCGSDSARPIIGDTNNS